eukprot:2128027-Alexandrium_andersonii.AAC.1
MCIRDSLSARAFSGVHGPARRALLVRGTLAVLGIAVRADAVAHRAAVRGAIRLALLARGDE